MILFQNILLLKEFLVCNGCFGLFTKIIKKSGTCFFGIFSAWFFYKNVLYLIYTSSIDKVSKSYLFFLFKISNKMCYWALIETINKINFKIYLYHPLKQWPIGRKKGRTEIQKFEYLENEKSFLDEIQSIFHSFWKAIIWWKNKNLMKIADRALKQ